MKIEVTQADIDAGKRDSCTSCPVAIVMRRATGRPLEAHHDQAVLIDGDDYTEIPLPAEARKFINLFDYGGPVGPFAFDLDYQAS